MQRKMFKVHEQQIDLFTKNERVLRFIHKTAILNADTPLTMLVNELS